MAVILEARFEKGDIMNAYINEIYLGQDGNRAVHGFGLASQFYFGKPLAELNLPEIALLVAVVRGPSYYDPRRNPERALERRNLVLRVLVEQEVVTAEDAERAAKKPLGLARSGPQGRQLLPGVPRPGAAPAAPRLRGGRPHRGGPHRVRHARPAAAAEGRGLARGRARPARQVAAQAGARPRGRGDRHGAADGRGDRAGRRAAGRVRRLQPRARRQAPDRLARQAAGLPRRARIGRVLAGLDRAGRTDRPEAAERRPLEAREFRPQAARRRHRDAGADPVAQPADRARGPGRRPRQGRGRFRRTRARGAAARNCPRCCSAPPT